MTQFISVSASPDGGVWGINLAGALLRANFTFDANTGERQVTWQPVASDRTWKQVAASETELIWCLDTGGNVYNVPASGEPGADFQLGNMTLAFLSAGDLTIWGLDANGKTFLYVGGGNTWTAAQTQPRPFTRLSVGDVTQVVALDSDGSAYTLGQNGWQTIGSGLIDISASTDGYVAAIGNKGNLMIQIGDDWFDSGGEGLKTISFGSLSNLVALDSSGNFMDLTQGRELTLGTGRKQSARFDTTDPFNEKKSTHLWLVNRGAMRAQGEFGDKFRQLLLPNPDQTEPGGTVFHQAVCQGLYDADYVDFFNGPIVLSYRQPSWESHFYDPDTGLNWREHASQTALTRGRSLFNAALAAYRVGRLRMAGYALGASLHYLTDMGQPMHAANFTWASIPVGWHASFEAMVMERQDQWLGGGLPSDSVTNIPDDYFINLARKSKALFLNPNNLRVNNRFPDLGEAGKNASSGAGSAAVDAILQDMLTNTVQAVADYVTEWMKRAEDVAFLAHAPICAGHQGPYWRSGLWSLDQQGQLQYFHTDQNTARSALPPFMENWAPGQNSVGANPPAAPTQLAACMNKEGYDGRAIVFALSSGNVYYTTQLSRYLSHDEQDVSGWTPWTMLQAPTPLKLICACPYTYGVGQVVTTGASVWGVGEDGVLRFAYQRSKTDGKSFDAYNPDAIVWTDWQVDNTAPKNMTCITATGTGSSKGYIFGLLDGDLYSAAQSDPRHGVGWDAWSKLAISGPAVKLRLITACEGIHEAGYIAQIWGVDDQGILRSATYSSVDNQWSPWSGEWNANSPRDIVALTSSGVEPGGDRFQLWALAGGKLYSIFQTIDATTKQIIWLDWTTFPIYAAGPLTPRSAQPAILSLVPADQVAIGPGQLLLIRGADLPDTVIFSQDSNEHQPQWTSSVTPQAALVRLGGNVHNGPATVRLINEDRTVSTAEFPITISDTPGTPVLTAVTTYPAMTPVSKVAPGQKIAISVESMDTSGAVIEWTHASLPALKSDSEFSTDGGVGGSKYCVVTTVPNVTPNDTWTLSLRLNVRNALSPAVSLTLQT